MRPLEIDKYHEFIFVNENKLMVLTYLKRPHVS
jgi:hypothetical protein